MRRKLGRCIKFQIPYYFENSPDMSLHEFAQAIVIVMAHHEQMLISQSLLQAGTHDRSFPPPHE